MRKMLTLIVLLFFANTAHALFGLADIKAKLNILGTQVENTSTEVTGIKANVKALNDNVIDLKVQLGIVAQANASAIAGVNNRINTTSSNTRARDITTTSSNDTMMLRELNNIFKSIIMGLAGQMVAVILQMIALLKWQSKMYNKLLTEKDRQIERLIESKDKKEAKNDEWQQKMIEGKIKVGG